MSWNTDDQDGVIHAIAKNRVELTDLVASNLRQDHRHADLAELVRELTVAVETLERKVDRLEGWTEGFSATIADAAAVNSLESKADWKGLAYVLAGKDQPDEGDTANASDTGEGVS